MLRWILMVKKLFTTPLTLVDYGRLLRAWRERAQARRTRNTVKLVLESLEARTVPSVSTGNPLAAEAVASPPAVQQMASIMSYAVSTLDQEIQVMATVEQNLLADARMLGQEFAQIVYSIEQSWGRLPGLNLNASAPSLGTTKQQPSSGSGSGSGSNSGHSSPVTATPPAHSPTIGLTAKKSGSGIGTMSDPGSSLGSVTISGQVWLDNNGDNGLDNGEMGFQGITVNLWSSGQTVASTTTNDNYYGNNYQFVVPVYSPSTSFQIEVMIPSGDLSRRAAMLTPMASPPFSAWHREAHRTSMRG